MAELKMGDRFKDYERVSDHYLTRRLPVIIRVDLAAGHTLTRGFEKPYDKFFADSMQKTALYLMENIQGAQIAYIQSDEISILLTDYMEITTEAWFNNRVNKMVSHSAARASIRFSNSISMYKGAPYIVGIFDSRAFNIPENDVCNYFVWRQKDAERNSLQSLAQAHFSHKSLQGLNSSALQEKLFTEKGINYNDIDPYQKRGAIVIRREGVWKIEPAPIFSQNREVIEELIPKP
jgi:tRNA(His) 5'-end guanylyltransferase